VRHTLHVLPTHVCVMTRYAAEHQLAVVDCLEDPDDTLKKKTLELLFKMTKPNNVEVREARSRKYANLLVCKCHAAPAASRCQPCAYHGEHESCTRAVSRVGPRVLVTAENVFFTNKGALKAHHLIRPCAVAVR